MPAIKSPDISRRLSPAAVPGLSAVTPVIITFNEAENIGRTLSALSWASSIVVIDSGSTDATLEILARHPAVTVVQRGYDNHASKWNFAFSVSPRATDNRPSNSCVWARPMGSSR